MADLLKLAIHIRQIMTRPELREYLAEHHPEDLKFFETVLAIEQHAETIPSPLVA